MADVEAVPAENRLVASGMVAGMFVYALVAHLLSALWSE